MEKRIKIHKVTIVGRDGNIILDRKGERELLIADAYVIVYYDISGSSDGTLIPMWNIDHMNFLE